MSVKLKASATTEITADLLARLFWDMDSEDQAAFFAELAKCGTHYDREMQWWYLHDELKSDDDATEALMAIAAPFYLHTLREWPLD